MSTKRTTAPAGNELQQYGDTESTWHGDPGRPFILCRPCSCGCDERGGAPGVGYLTGSTEDGRGFTLWITSEDTYQRIKRVLSLWSGRRGLAAPA